MQQFKPFLIFIGKFLLTYLLLTFLYQFYLNLLDTAKHEVDGFTQLVANQTKSLLNFFGGVATSEKNISESCMNLFYNGKWIARIIEGCNALSIIILFVSFVISFSGKLKHTVLFILLGSLSIHIINVTRIALLAVLIFEYPEYETFLHDIFFPLIIYGFVFLLWVYWVNTYSKYATKSSK